MALVFAFAWRVFVYESKPTMMSVEGTTMGSIIYHVKYSGSTKDYTNEIDQILIGFNKSLSTYEPSSEISMLNKNGEITVASRFFIPVMRESKRVYEATNGAFDPTVGPLINAWGFGPESRKKVLDAAQVDSLKSLIGFEKVQFSDSSIVIPKGFKLDFSAIAKGYAVDLVGEFLESEGINNYMVEIGGELRCRGKNKEGESWSIGVEDPLVDIAEKKILAIVKMKDLSLATSGNYRNYFEEDGKLYAHIIDPSTGYTASHSLLSASVFTSNCMTADAYATAFMVLGLDQSKKIIESDQELEAILVYRSGDSIKSYISEGIAPFIAFNKTDHN